MTALRSCMLLSGHVHAGMAVFDTMRYIKSDVSTVCVGLAASMGAFILASGQKVCHSNNFHELGMHLLSVQEGRLAAAHQISASVHQADLQKDTQHAYLIQLIGLQTMATSGLTYEQPARNARYLLRAIHDFKA